MLFDVFVAAIAFLVLIIVIGLLAWRYLREPADEKQEFSTEIEKAVDILEGEIVEKPRTFLTTEPYNGFRIDTHFPADSGVEFVSAYPPEITENQSVFPEIQKTVDTIPVGNMTVEQMLEMDWQERLEYQRMLFRAENPRYYRNNFYREWRKELSRKSVEFAQDRMKWRVEMGLSAT